MRKEFWAFVVTQENETSLKSEAGISVKSTRSKLDALQRHNQED